MYRPLFLNAVFKFLIHPLICISLMLGASMGSLSQKMFINFNLVHNLTMAWLISEHLIVRALQSVSTFYDKNYTKSAKNGACTRTKKSFQWPFMPKNGPAHAFLQPAKIAAMSTPHPLNPPFLLAQNFFLKRIAPTDNEVECSLELDQDT